MPVVGKTRLLATRQIIHCFPPNNLVDPPPLRNGNENVTALQGQMLMHGKSASEHVFSGVGCNLRVLKMQGFSGTSRAFRVCWPPCSLSDGNGEFLAYTNHLLTQITLRI